jgi:hypothetical protein
MNNLGIELIIDENTFTTKINDSISISNANNEYDLESNNDLKLCRIMTQQRTYLCVDDVFKSEFGNYYVDVYINNTFVKLDIGLILEVFDIPNNTPSFLSKNWLGLKDRLIRKDKFKRILSD